MGYKYLPGKGSRLDLTGKLVVLNSASPLAANTPVCGEQGRVKVWESVV